MVQRARVGDGTVVVYQRCCLDGISLGLKRCKIRPAMSTSGCSASETQRGFLLQLRVPRLTFFQHAMLPIPLNHNNQLGTAFGLSLGATADSKLSFSATCCEFLLLLRIANNNTLAVKGRHISSLGQPPTAQLSSYPILSFLVLHFICLSFSRYLLWKQQRL